MCVMPICSSRVEREVIFALAIGCEPLETVDVCRTTCQNRSDSCTGLSKARIARRLHISLEAIQISKPDPASTHASLNHQIGFSIPLRPSRASLLRSARPLLPARARILQTRLPARQIRAAEPQLHPGTRPSRPACPSPARRAPPSRPHHQPRGPRATGPSTER